MALITLADFLPRRLTSEERADLVFYVEMGWLVVGTPEEWRLVYGERWLYDQIETHRQQLKETDGLALDDDEGSSGLPEDQRDDPARAERAA